MPQYVALDLHRDYTHRCRLEPHPEGAKMKHSRFPNTREGWARFVEAEATPDTWVAFEVTGNAFEVYDLLSPHVGKVLLTKPTAAKERGSGRKTDRSDTERLAMGLAQGTLPAVWVPPWKVRALRRLLQARARTNGRRKAVGNQLRAVLRRHWVKVPAGRDVASWLKDHPQAWEALDEADAVVAVSLLRQYRMLSEEVEALTAEIAGRVRGEPLVALLLTIPGVSLLTAAYLYAWIGDPARFRGPRQVARYAGLDPSVHESGETKRRGRISKHGCQVLRTALIEAAHSLARFDTGPLGQFFGRLRQRMGYAKAVVALARKLLIVAWRMMLTGTPYRGERPKTTARKVRALERQGAARRAASTLRQELLGPEAPAKAPVPAATGQGPGRKRTPVLA